jgi:hypothetical protein
MKFSAKVFPYLIALYSIASVGSLQAKEQKFDATENKVYEPIRNVG